MELYFRLTVPDTTVSSHEIQQPLVTPQPHLGLIGKRYNTTNIDSRLSHIQIYIAKTGCRGAYRDA